MAIICSQLGYTYQQYLSQPAWFIQLLLLKLQEDSNYQNQTLNQ